MASSKNILYPALIIFGTLLLLLTPAIGRASGESYGWFAPTVEYIDEVSTSICPADKYTLDIALANYSSTSTITVGAGVWYLNLMDAAGNIISSDMYNGQSVSNPICVDPAGYYIQVIVNETASYYGIETPSLRPSRTSGLFAQVAPSTLTSSHFRGYVHLQTKGGASAISNISSIFPDGDALKTTPDFIVRTNELPGVYGPSTLKSIKVHAYNVTDSTYKTVTVPASGGLATRQISGMPSLDADGPYLWFYHQNFTGTNPTRSQFGSWTYNSLPSTGVTTPLSFIIDSKVPEINNISEVKTVASIGTNQIQAEVKVSAQDTISGLAHSALIIKDTATGNLVSQIDTNMAGQLDLLNLSFNIVVTENQSYTITHELTDRAGNLSVSNSVVYGTPTVVSLNAPTLEARDASEIGTEQAFIPSYISSNGGSGIVERGTCWALNASAFTSVTGLTNCLSETSWATVSDVGVFGFTHVDLPASTTIYYRGFARNGNTTGYSPIRSFVTKSFGDVILVAKTPPVIGALYASSTTANSAEISMRLDDTGGDLITQRAICWNVNAAALPTSPNDITDRPNCYVDNTLMNYPYTLPYWTTHTFYNLPSNSPIYIKGYVANVVGTTTQLLTITTPKEILDIAQPDFNVTQTYDSAVKTYDLDFSVSAQDLSNFLPPPIALSSPQALLLRIVPYTAYLSDLGGTLVASLNGTVEASSILNPIPAGLPDIISLNFSNVNPGLYQLKVEVNDPESTYLERAASTTAGFNNIRIKLLNLPDPDGGAGTPPLPPTSPGFSLYFDRIIARSQMPTKLYWNTVLPYDMSCKIYGGSDFGPTAIYNFNPSIDGYQGYVELNSLKNYQTFELTCVDTTATGLRYSTSTSITLTGSYSPI